MEISLQASVECYFKLKQTFIQFHVIIFIECTHPLGMYSGALSDSNIKKSFRISGDCQAYGSRIGLVTRWCSYVDPGYLVNLYLEVKFTQLSIIHGIRIKRYSFAGILHGIKLAFSLGDGLDDEYEYIGISKDNNQPKVKKP